MNKTNKEFSLSAENKKLLLGIARDTIHHYSHEGIKKSYDKNTIPDELLMNCGVFVTLRTNGRLKGCIGRFKSNEALYALTQEMAISSATRDPRFKPLKKNEIDSIKIEISVLSPLRKIESEQEIELGKHGIYITKGTNSGTFLPQVATDTGWSIEEFLGHCSKNKAGLGWLGWKNADVYIYTAEVFSEE